MSKGIMNEFFHWYSKMIMTLCALYGFSSIIAKQYLSTWPLYEVYKHFKNIFTHNKLTFLFTYNAQKQAVVF